MTALTHRERVIKTLRGEPTDRIARGEFFIADEFVRAFLSSVGSGVKLPNLMGAGVELQHQREQQVIEQLDLDIAPVTLSEGWGALAQPDEDRALEAVMRWRAESDRFVFALIDGPFSAAVKATGFDALTRYVHSIPRVARDAFQQGAEDARVIARAVRDAGADGVILGEDIAYGRSPYLAPDDLRELYFPALRDVAREIRALGLAVFFHSDGNLNAVLDDLAACELDGMQGLEPDAGMSIGAVRERVGSALTLWGNLGFEFLSVARTDEEIEEAVCALTAAPGKLIAGSCSGLVPGLNAETVKRVYRAM